MSKIHDTILNIPGFGCVYPFDAHLSSASVTLELRSIIKEEQYKFSTDDLIIIMPLEAASVHIKDAQNKKHIVESGSIYKGGQSSEISIASPLAFCRFAILSFKRTLFSRLSLEHTISLVDIEKAFEHPKVLHRPDWLEALSHRYIFERAIMHEKNNNTTKFLEIEILKEAYYRSSPVKEAPLFKNLPVAVREALITIEKNILNDLDLDELAEASSLSKASLNRLFSRHIGLTPIRYFWGRRLTLASFLLERDEKTVEEIAALVGFQDLSSFSRAYRRYFGKAPRRN